MRAVALIDRNDLSRKGVHCMSSEGSSASSQIFKNGIVEELEIKQLLTPLDYNSSRLYYW